MQLLSPQIFRFYKTLRMWLHFIYDKLCSDSLILLIYNQIYIPWPITWRAKLICDLWWEFCHLCTMIVQGSVISRIIVSGNMQSHRFSILKECPLLSLCFCTFIFLIQPFCPILFCYTMKILKIHFKIMVKWWSIFHTPFYNDVSCTKTESWWLWSCPACIITIF